MATAQWEQLAGAPVIRAVVTALTGFVVDGNTVPVGDGESRQGAQGARIVVSRLPSGVPDGTMAQPNIDGSHIFDIACIGRTTGECAYIVDLAWAAIIAIDPFDGQTVLDVNSLGQPGIFAEVDVEPQEFVANMRVQIETTPT